MITTTGFSTVLGNRNDRARRGADGWAGSTKASGALLWTRLRAGRRADVCYYQAGGFISMGVGGRAGQQPMWRPMWARMGSSRRPHVLQASSPGLAMSKGRGLRPPDQEAEQGCRAAGLGVACHTDCGAGRSGGWVGWGRACLALATRARSAASRTSARALLISWCTESGITRPPAVKPIVLSASSRRSEASPTQAGMCWAYRFRSCPVHH